jgi:hypothetical protein
MMCVHFENFIGFTVHRSSIVTFFHFSPLALAFFLIKTKHNTVTGASTHASQPVHGYTGEIDVSKCI